MAFYDRTDACSAWRNAKNQMAMFEVANLASAPSASHVLHSHLVALKPDELVYKRGHLSPQTHTVSLSSTMSSTFQDITSKSLEVKSSLLTAGFAGDLITPTDSDYEASIKRCAKNAQKRAGLVAYVKSSEDVSRIIKYATSNNVQIVVRGGGHSVSGSSSVEGGIVIDLSKHLNAVRIDEEKRLGYVGGGANWAAVDTEAIKYGLASVGGTVNHTGVGG